MQEIPIIIYLILCCSYICSLQNRAQVEKLVHYIVEEASEDAEEKQIFK